MLLESGELDRRITILARKSTVNEYGELPGSLDSDWEPVAVYWGKLTKLSSRNADIAKGFAETVQYEAKLRYHSDISNANRCRIGSDHYEINGLVNEPDKSATTLFLTREQA